MDFGQSFIDYLSILGPTYFNTVNIQDKKTFTLCKVPNIKKILYKWLVLDLS